MRIILLILLIVFQASVFSQVPVEKLNTALKSRHFSTFRNTLTEIRKDKSIHIGNAISREIINDYREVLYEIYDTMTWNSHNIKLILKGNEIILYHLSILKVKIDNKQRIQFIQVIDSFRNTSKSNTFKLDFKKIYETDLSEDDLWQSKVVGIQCGLIINPEDKLEDYIKMESFVTSKNNDSLLVWLKSVNREKQMFGLWGFSKLKKNGYNLTESELKFIKIALGRKGSVTICGGCESSIVTIKEFTKNFNFDN